MASSKQTVMIVDDIADNRMLLECLLEDEYDTLSVSSGQECLKNLSEESLPSLVLLDIRMPGMDGFEVCQQMKNNQNTRNVPIIFVTAETAQEEKLKGYEYGADDFVSKPFDQDELFAKIRRTINSKIEMENLSKQANMAREAALTAMANSSDLGLIIQFMDNSNQCQDFNALAIQLLETTKSFGLICNFQFVNKDFVFNIGCEDNSLEARLISEARRRGNIVGKGQRLFFNQQHISMLVKNMPEENPDLYGRLKDNLSVLINAAENVARSVALAEEIEEQRRGGVQKAINSAHKEIQFIDELINHFGKTALGVLENIRNEFEDSLLSLGLSEQQEEQLLKLFEEGFNEMDNVKELQEDIGRSTQNMISDLAKLTH